MNQAKVVTIQQTGKGWKFGKLLSVLLMVGAFISCVSSHGEGGSIDGSMGLFFGGLLLYICSRAGAWWSHG